jgi:hypothetical protein
VIEEVKSAYKILVRKSEEKRPCGRFWHRWENNIKIDVKTGYQDVNWFVWYTVGNRGGFL